MEAEPKNYEIAYLVSPLVPEEDLFGEAGKITGFIQDIKGFIRHIEEPRRRALAYPINKFREAYFGWTQFFAHPAAVADLEKKLKLEPNIIRFLIVKAEERQTEQHIIRQGTTGRTAKTATPPAESEKIDLGALDKRLEEILGK